MKALRNPAVYQRTILSSSIMALLSIPAVRAQTTDTWSAGASGNWSVAADWSAGVVPNNGTPSGSTYNVDIVDGVSTVTLNISPTINDLTMGKGNTLVIAQGESLAVDGPTIANAGSVQVAGGGGSNTSLVLDGNTTLSGAGTLTLSAAAGGGSAYLEEGASSITLTNSSTINGTGIIGNSGLAVVNSGTIDANSTAGAGGILMNGSGGITNTGLLEATNGAALNLSTNVVNTGANITASGTGSVVDLSGITVTGGTLTASGGGALAPSGTVTLDDVTLSAGTVYPVAPGTTTVLAGTFTNNGSVTLTANSGSNTALDINNNLTLNGPVTMAYSGTAGGGNNYIQEDQSSVTLTNSSTINGTGIIGNSGLAVVNSGTIDANSTAGAGGILMNGSGGVTNTGLLEATNGAALNLSTNVVNTGANITASGTGSVVDLSGITVTGGTLTASGGGALAPSGTVTLDDVTLSAGTVYPVAPGTTTILAGTFTNNGSVTMTANSGSNTILDINNNLTLKGPVTMAYSGTAGGGNDFIQESQSSVTLTNDGTISGSGVIGNSGLALVNAGTIDANSTSGAAGILLNGSGGITNKDLLEASGGGALTVDTNVVNTGANITATGAGSSVLLDGVTVTGGTLTVAGGASMSIAGTTTLNGSPGAVTLKGALGLNAGSTALVLGTLDNLGSITVNGGAGSNTVLAFGSGTVSTNTLTDSGTIKLIGITTSGGSAYIEEDASSVVLKNVNNTIQGEGVIGNSGLALDNETKGIIDANSTGGTVGTPLNTALTLNGSGGIVNTGLMEATNSGALDIDNAVTNTGGSITASGAGATVNFDGATITGGTLTGVGGGAMTATGSTTLSGVTLAAGTPLTVPLGNSLNLDGTITNGGAITVNGGNGTNSVVLLGNSVNLTGGGTVTLSTVSTNGGNTYIEENATGLTLTNTNNTIQGDGIIGNGGLTVVNAAGGTISSNVSGGTLLLNGSGDITNSGTLAVASGALLHLTNGAFTNFSGTTLTGGTYNIAGTLEIDELGSTGGEIVTNAANIILNGTGASFVDDADDNALSKLAVNAAAGSFTVDGGDTFTTSGNFTNNGILAVGAGSTFAVASGKSLTNFAGTTLTGGTYDVTGTFEFPGANIVTDAANITLGGSGAEIKNSTTSGNGLAGLASIASTGSFALAGGANFTTAGSFTNDGTLTVGSGSAFTVAPSASLTNFSGTTLTGGTYDVSGTLAFAGANIVTDAANITLTGPAAQIENSTTSGNGLANLATIAAKSSLTLLGDANFTTAGNFDNKGTLSVGAGSTFDVGGKLTNFSTTTDTLTGGTYDVTGTVEFAGANIVTNAAKVNLTGTTAQILNSTSSTSGLANFASNAATGTFSLAGGANFTTVGNFSTAGTVTIGTGSTFTVGGAGVFAQTAGTTTDSGALAAAGGLNLSGGSLFASGTVTGNLDSSGIVTPGTSAIKTGILTDVGTYTQAAGGSLDIRIAGTTAGTKFDALDTTTAVLGGTLNITSGFTPTVGSTFKILNFGSETGTFATVNGLTINGTEAYTVTYQPTDVLLTVVSTPAARTTDTTQSAAGSVEDRARVGAALRDFNADFAQGGRAVLAMEQNRVLSAQRLQKHISALDMIRAHR